MQLECQRVVFKYSAARKLIKRDHIGTSIAQLLLSQLMPSFLCIFLPLVFAIFFSLLIRFDQVIAVSIYPLYRQPYQALTTFNF